MKDRMALAMTAYDRARNLPGDGAAREAKSGGGQPEATAQAAAAPGLGTATQALTSSNSAYVFVKDNGGCDWGPDWSYCRVN
jgi:hypothetical protein